MTHPQKIEYQRIAVSHCMRPHAVRDSYTRVRVQQVSIPSPFRVRVWVWVQVLVAWFRIRVPRSGQFSALVQRHLPQNHRQYYNSLASRPIVSLCIYSCTQTDQPAMLWIQHFKILPLVVEPSDNEGTVAKKIVSSVNEKPKSLGEDSDLERKSKNDH